MSFGFSVGDFVAALTVLNNVRIALQDSNGASTSYREEISFLQALSLTVQHLDTLQLCPLDDHLSKNIQDHYKQLKEPIHAFVDGIENSYDGSLGWKTTAPKVLTAHRRIQWALSTSKKVRRLREKIATPLLAIQITLSQQIVLTCLRMPREIQMRLANTIDTVIDSRIRPLTESTFVTADAFLEHHVQSPNIMLQLLRELLQTTTKNSERQSSENHKVAEEIKCFSQSLISQIQPLGRQLHRLEEKSLDAHEFMGQIHASLDTVVSIKSEIRDMLASQACSNKITARNIRMVGSQSVGFPRRQRGDIQENASSIHQKLDKTNELLESMANATPDLPSLSQHTSVKTERSPLDLALRDILYGGQMFFSSLLVLVRELMYLLMPFILNYYRAVIQPLLRTSIPPRLLTSLENGVQFEDALGRLSILPLDIFGSHETLNKMLQCGWFETFLEVKVAKWFYIISCADPPYDVITPETWDKSIVSGARIAMSMTFMYPRKFCPRCVAMAMVKMCPEKDRHIINRLPNCEGPKAHTRLRCSTCNVVYHHHSRSPPGTLELKSNSPSLEDERLD